MRQVLFQLWLPILLIVPCFAQEGIPCPNIRVAALDKIYQPGETLYFSVSADRELKNLKLEYKWNVSRGTIERGQGTPDILISSAGLDDLSVTATVEIKGLPQNCPNTFSGTTDIGRLPAARLIDHEFDLSDPDVMKARIDSLYTALLKQPTSRGAVITYGTRTGVAERERAIRKIIRLRKYDIKRIDFIRAINGQQVHTQFFITPKGEKPPVPQM